MTTTQGYFVFEVDSELRSCGFGEIGQFVILDQSNEVPDYFMGRGPWETREQAQQELDSLEVE